MTRRATDASPHPGRIARCCCRRLLPARGASPARAEVQHRRHPRQVEPMPIAIPPFPGGGEDAQTGRDIAGVVSADLERSGLFRPLDPKTSSRTSSTGDRAALRRLAPDQCPGAGHRARCRRRPTAASRVEFRLWDVVRRAAARRLCLHHHPAELAPHRAHHRRRDLQADHRRGRLFRHPHRLRRRDPARPDSGSSGWRSWTRTAPTTSTSPMAARWC